MARTNTKNDTKTRPTSWRNRHLEKLYFFRTMAILFNINYNIGSMYQLNLKSNILMHTTSLAIHRLVKSK